MAITQYHNWTTGDDITAARLNGNITNILTGGISNYDSEHAVGGGHKAVTTTGTITCATGITIAAGGLTITAGGQTITAGSFLLSAGNVTVTSGNITVTSGNFTLTSGDFTMSSGNLALTSGSLTLTSGSLTLTSGTLINSAFATNSLCLADGVEVPCGATAGKALVSNTTGSAPAYGEVDTAGLADSAITKVKQESMGSGTKTAGAGQTAVSTASGAYIESGTSYSDATNLSVTLTTTGRPVAVFLQPGTTGSCYISADKDSTNGSAITAKFKVLRDAVSLGELPIGYSVGSVTTTLLSLSLPPGSMYFVDTVSAGTYTYKVQGKRVGSGCTANIIDCQLIAHEL